jgi:hypothetical protein
MPNSNILFQFYFYKQIINTTPLRGSYQINRDAVYLTAIYLLNLILCTGSAVPEVDNDTIMIILFGQRLQIFRPINI